MKNVLVAKNFGWRKIKILNNILFIKGIVYNFTDLQIIKELNNNKSIVRINSFIKKIDGHFALIYQDKNNIISAVDRVGSIPLFYFYDKKKYYVTPFPFLLKNKFKKKIIYNQALSMSMSSYTIGENSIYSNFKIITGGSFTLFKNKDKKTQKISYNRYEPWKINYQNSYSDSKKKLHNLNLKIIKKLHRYSLKNNKKIAIPLSAGYDSRFIVSCLKEIGAKNVFCYSYGQKNNFEAQAAKKIAKKLGYEWYFVELTHSKIYRLYRSKSYLNFSKKFETFCSCPESNTNEFLAIKELHKKKILKNSIIVNGNSGDFISGAHILKYSNKGKNSQEIIYNLIQAFIEKHFRLWDYLVNIDNDKIIYDLLINEIKNLKIYKKIDKKNLHSIIEFLEFYNRQSKHVCSRQRIYEYFNYEWALPLWDRNYIDFWETIQIKYKLEQKLYEDVLITENYGDVWSEKKWINLKDLKITPIIFRYLLRPFAKSFFIFLEKSAWHKFERRYILYFTDVSCGMGIKKYKDIIIDKRGFRNFLALHADKYVKKILNS